MKIVLYQPEIPQNTGNIGRLCVATETPLYLVGPLGFHITDRNLKRAGLDYWQYLEWKEFSSLEEVQQEAPKSRLLYFTTKANRSYTDISYQKSDILVFGPETRGLPDNILKENLDSLVKIPMWGKTRSLNLSTCAGIALYEAYRQTRAS